MAEEKSYSPDAIQERQGQATKASRAKQKALLEKAQPVQPTVKPTEKVPQTGTGAPNYSLLAGNNSYIQTPKAAPLDNLPKAKPYMAYDVTTSGLAIFGVGFTGWVRKSWADLTDPNKYKQDIGLLSEGTQQAVNDSYEGRVDSWSSIIEEKTRWSEWGEKVFNLSARDIAALPAGLSTEKQITEELSKEEGDTPLEATAQKVGTAAARAVRVGVDTVQNALWGGLEILGLADKAVRKINSAVMGVDAVADKFDKDEADNIFESILQTGSIALAKDVITVARAIKDKRIDIGEVKEIVTNEMKGSEMMYTMAFDNAMRAKFELGVAEGKDPILLAQEYGNIGIELAGSILGDPTTYFGMSIIKPVNIFSKTGRLSAKTITMFGKTIPLPYKVLYKIPELSEIIGANIGKVRLANASTRFVNNAIPELENVLKVAGDVKNDRQAIQVIEKAVTVVANKMDDMRKHKQWWNLASVDSVGKVRRVSSDADYFIKGLLAENGLNDTLQILSDMRLLRAGGLDSVEAAKRLIPKGGGVFSDVGMMVGEIVARLDNDNILEAVKKSRNFSETYDGLYRTLEKAVGDFIPSVDEMLSAERAIKAGENISDSTRQLAAMAKELPAAVRIVNKITRPSEKITKAATSGMVQVFMNLVPRSWARNVYGQAVMLAMQTDVATAMSVSIEALTAGLKSSWATDVLQKTNSKIIKALGFSPNEAMKGIGDAIQAGTKTKWGFLPAMQRSEQLTASQIILKTAGDEIQKALPAVLKNFPEWDNLTAALSKEHQSVMLLALKRANGNTDEALKLFRDITGKGEIEAWRLAEPPANMRRHLEAINMLDEFYEIQRGAQSMDEFKNFLSTFANAYAKSVEKAAQKLPSTLTKMPTELYDFGVDLGKIADPSQKKIMTELIQSWQNTLDQLTDTTNGIIRSMRNATRLDAAAFNRVEQAGAEIENIAKASSEQYRTINTLREQIHLLKKTVQETTDKQELIRLWGQNIDYKGKSFNLSKIFPDMDLSKLTPEMFQRRMWQSFFETAADVYRNGNSSQYTETMKILEGLTKELGAPLENFAARAGDDNPLYLLQKMFQESQDIEDAVSWRRFLNQFNFEEMPTNPDGTPILLKQVMGKFQDTFKTWKGGQRHIEAAVNKDLGKTIPYDQITLEQAYKAIWNRKRVPPDDGTINEARIMWETKDAFLEDVARWGESVIKDWGTKVKASAVDDTPELRKFVSAFEARMQPVRQMAGRVAVNTRDFVLHDYDKTYLDHALTYLYGNSFHYWTTRTYSKAIETLLANPGAGSAYLKYKQYITKEHADMPEFYRSNTVVDNLLGIDLQNPYYLNLESMINPVYGLTGTDFNDPRKRVDWITRLVDDTNKFGPSFSPLVSWALATKLYMEGKEGAGQRWLGRLLPQSQVIKSTTAALFGKAIEVDPFVMLTNKKFSGGVDAYERNRVVAALAMMVRDKTISQEEMIDAARTEEGIAWEMAVQASAEKRFSGDIASFFVGVGARPRTQEDLIINKFWGDYSALLSSKSMMTADQYRTAWENLRDNPQYGMFVDGLLLGRKTGDEQQEAFAYNVLSRIPPGELNPMVERLGIKPYMIETFYDNKGDISSLTPQDQARFEAAIVDLSAMLKMPANATKQEWNAARATYSAMKSELEKEFGEDIFDKISQFYDIDDSDEKERFMEANPEVNQALERQTGYIVGTPILSAYYGSLDTVERYYTTQVYKQLEQEFGANIDDVIETYNFLQENLQTEEAKKFYKQQNLKAYYDRRKELLQGIDDDIINAAQQIPEGIGYDIRPEFQTQSGYQEEALQYATTDQQAVTAEEIWAELSPAAQTLIQESLQAGEPLPPVVGRQLDRIAAKYGMSQYEALRLLGVEQ